MRVGTLYPISPNHCTPRLLLSSWRCMYVRWHCWARTRSPRPFVRIDTCTAEWNGAKLQLLNRVWHALARPSKGQQGVAVGGTVVLGAFPHALLMPGQTASPSYCTSVQACHILAVLASLALDSASQCCAVLSRAGPCWPALFSTMGYGGPAMRWRATRAHAPTDG